MFQRVHVKKKVVWLINRQNSSLNSMLSVLTKSPPKALTAEQIDTATADISTSEENCWQRLETVTTAF